MTLNIEFSRNFASSQKGGDYREGKSLGQLAVAMMIKLHATNTN